jgi:SAM-dependent MidA family methyltransferase
VVSPAALELFDAMLRTIERGYVLLVDYTAADPSSAMVHGYRRHRVEEDVVADPGSRDITTGVDLASLGGRGARAGAQVWGPVSQRDLLLNLGFRDWDAAWRDRQLAAAADRRSIEAMRIYAMRSRATLLVDPGALGGFGVLCIGRGDVPPADEVRVRT